MHGEEVVGLRRVKTPAGVTTLGTRALDVGRGGKPLRVDPRCGYIHGKRAEWFDTINFNYEKIKLSSISGHEKIRRIYFSS